MNLMILMVFAPIAASQKYTSMDLRGKMLDDTLSVSSRLYPQKVQPSDVAEGGLSRYARQKTREIRVSPDGIVLGELHNADNNKNFPVFATFSVQDLPRHKGLVLDDYPNSRKFNGQSFDEYVSSVTDPDINHSTSSDKDVIELLRPSDDERDYGKKAKTKYIADFENAFEIPEDKLPLRLKEPSHQTDAPKKKQKKKSNKPLFLTDARLKELSLTHEKALDDLNSFASMIKSVETKEKPVYEYHPYGKPQTPLVTYSPIYTSRTTTTKKTYGGFQPVTLPTGATANRNKAKKVHLRFEDTPQASRLNQFLKNSEDERLEIAVRKALESLRKTRGSPIGSASSNRPVSQSGGGRDTRDGPPQRPPPRRRPFNKGPSPVRVFNFNN